MHQGNKDWLASLSKQYANEINGASILEIGSMDWNGSARPYFKAAARYVGVDHCDGPAVDIVCPAVATKFMLGEFDILICLSVFEHDPNWIETFHHNLQWVKEGGLLVVCWGAEGNQRHDPEPWAIVPVADFIKAATEWPISVSEGFFEVNRFTPDCSGCYDVVARKCTPVSDRHQLSITAQDVRSAAVAVRATRARFPLRERIRQVPILGIVLVMLKRAVFGPRRSR